MSTLTFDQNNPSIIQATSAHGDIGSVKQFESIAGIGPVQGSWTQGYGAMYMVANSANSFALNTILTALGIQNIGFSAIVASYGYKELWATKDPVPVSGFPPSNAKFTKIYFSGFEPSWPGNLA